VIRRLLSLSKNIESSSERLVNKEGWMPAKDVCFPEGTEFRGMYKARQYRGWVKNGGLEVHGKKFYSPSAAAISITNNTVNGWIFWEARLPGENSWKVLQAFRRK
jgi:hypothetical protein